ncbi:MAG: hypothetical protein L0332_24130 [Chloroflexi bacterium]|nr:hypothetical protein [Chloroflexota bacterium]MCI0576968.1 hypothetical protein [Chloroflexota bacterium]MCI0649364.1 hypothetical protein [Chloroflexota bacterium]MCI0729783.1 hypothetical protein [Chloroflexota bacterium]
MKVNLGRLEILKKKLVAETDFYRVFNYFFDHFGENEAFLDLGGPTRHPTLEKIIAQVGGGLLGTRVVLMNLLLIRLPEQGFIHGGCVLNGHVVNFFYFEDIQVGMMAIALSRKQGETKIVRFSGLTVPGEPKPSLN